MSCILITRPIAQAAATQERLETAGYRTICAPLLEIEALGVSLPEVPPQAVLLTSQNAVPALAGSALSRAIPVYAVGERTAAELRQHGFTNVESASGDSGDLVALVMQRCQHGLGSLLYLAGDVVAGDVAGRLSAAGFWVDRQMAYRAHAATTLPAEAVAALAAGEIRTVLLYSPRSAAILARLVADKTRLHLVCLSAAVAAAAGEGWHNITVSDKPDETSLLEALLKQTNVL